MTKTQENIISMFVPVERILQENKSIWSAMPGFVQIHNQFMEEWTVMSRVLVKYESVILNRPPFMRNIEKFHQAMRDMDAPRGAIVERSHRYNWRCLPRG